MVDVQGHVSGLLTLGAGFDVELTGRENILLAGAFLGLDDRVTREILPAVVEFADLGQFIDAPLKTYSSGMRARLGFAIATSVDPDVLLLDEVLATGDATFREKSKGRVIDLVEDAKAVVLVTHDMNWVKEYCNRAILLEGGRLVLEGSPDEVVALHQQHTKEAKERRAREAAEAGLAPVIAAGQSVAGTRLTAVTTSAQWMARMRRILTIDGGGVRGLIPGDRARRRSSAGPDASRERRSTSWPDVDRRHPRRRHRRRHPRDRLLALYLERSPRLLRRFPLVSLVRRIATGAMYETDELHDLIREELGETSPDGA